MADYRRGIPRAEISSLKETLCAQQKLLQKLYNELDAEREASASAASEALSVILRLQGEKAAVKMEAEQYKRLAEEKICHAEESFAVIEDIITQKEMEVAALDYQVQTLRYRLSTMGCADLGGGGEITYPENLLMMNQQFVGDTGIYNLARRNSAPVLNKYMKFINEKDNFSSLDEETGQEAHDLPSDSDKRLDGFADGGISYVEEIKKLDLLVKEITGDSYMSSTFGNPSSSNKKASSSKKAVTFDDPCVLKVHDVFEVPQVDKECRNCESSEAGEDLEKSDLVIREYIKPYGKDEPDWLKKLLESTHNEQHLCKPSDIATIHRAVVHPGSCDPGPRTSEDQCDRNEEIIELQGVVNSTGELKVLKEIKERLDFLEDTIRCSQKAMRQEEMELFKDIKEHLNLLQDEIRSCKANKSSTRNKLLERQLQEAMLWFWL